jgi:ATP-dependent protease HslVU (ClpYQ) ATPase subunit
VAFIFDKTLKPLRTPKPAQALAMDSQKREDIFSKTMNVSDKIKNEILPLLNCSDDDIDELDDEVAMISNKKDPLYQDEINHEDIKVEINTNPSVIASITKSEDLEASDRNFNTMPRNYLEGQIEDEQKRKVGVQGAENEIFKNENDMTGCL